MSNLKLIIRLVGIGAALWLPAAAPAQDGPVALETLESGRLWAVEAVQDELPPPPEAFPPAVDLGVLRAARMASGPVPDAPQAVALLTEPVRPSGMVDQILQDVGRNAGQRRMLEQMLFDQLHQAVPGAEDYLFEQATLPDLMDLPAGGWRVQYHFRLPNRSIGRATYTADLTDPQGGMIRHFSGTVFIDRESSGLTVRRVVRRGERLTDADLDRLSTRLSQLPRGAFDQPEQAIGAVANKELRPGEWLTDAVVSAPATVKRGQTVTMRLERGALTITGRGQACEDGRLGQTIRVTNAQSGRDIHARVLSQDEVQVVF